MSATRGSSGVSVISATHDDSTSSVGTLAILPREIRDRIYDYLFNYKETRDVILAYCDRDTGSIKFVRNITRLPPSEHVVQCLHRPSHAIDRLRKEMLPRFFQNARFEVWVKSSFEWESGRDRFEPVHDFSTTILPWIRKLDIRIRLKGPYDVPSSSADSITYDLAQKFCLHIVVPGQRKDVSWKQKKLKRSDLRHFSISHVVPTTDDVIKRCEWIDEVLAHAGWLQSGFTPSMLVVILSKLSFLHIYQRLGAPNEILEEWENMDSRKAGTEAGAGTFVLPQLAYKKKQETDLLWSRLGTISKSVAHGGRPPASGKHARKRYSYPTVKRLRARTKPLKRTSGNVEAPTKTRQTICWPDSAR